MAVYDRGYRGYAGGPLTPEWGRFLVLSRYSLRDVFASRFFLVYFLACFLFPVFCGLGIYLHYNVEALTALDLSVLELFKIDASFFHLFLSIQSGLAFVLALVVGPALISPDLRNNAMPLYLSRPLDRFDYALGKWVVLAVLLSVITWVPGWVLFAFQAYLAEEGWLLANARIGVALFVGAWAWILLLSLLSLAISAWVKWKPFARVIFLGTFFILSSLGGLFRGLYGTWHGSLLIPSDLLEVIWDQLFGLESDLLLSPALAWLALAFAWGSCGLLLFRRIRAYEVST